LGESLLDKVGKEGTGKVLFFTEDGKGIGTSFLSVEAPDEVSVMANMLREVSLANRRQQAGNVTYRKFLANKRRVLT